ncbi:hypothetical protein Sango_2690600 [Sesamum angolense]|uniref:Retrotransposon gag protein n=1 Tax=Sesamum angolense TaxID=2727404 RepID=A0AAE1W2Q4_9LAMI|nr:hypothetical protein Sango_2690600 [Sesamum angolense]
MSPLAEYVEKKLHSPSYVTEIDANKSPPSSPCSVSSYSIAPVMIPVDQLKEFIEGTIRSKIEESSKLSLTYSRPYTPRIDSLKMPMGYQPPKFQQFDGKGNPKQHVAHFIETCNNAGTYGDHLAKQFVRSLKGNAFVWYTDLEELRRNKEKQEMKKEGKPFSKAPSKESMAVNVAPLKLKSTTKDNVAQGIMFLKRRHRGN